MKKRFIVITGLVALWVFFAIPALIPSNSPLQQTEKKAVVTNDELAKVTPKKDEQESPVTDVVPTTPPPVERPVTVPNSPKQTEIRTVTVDEKIYYALQTANDPGYGASWALQSMNVPAAWDTATGNGQTVVAVIDTGFGLNHDDLINNWHENSDETGVTVLGDRCWTGIPANKTLNNCDDDTNGYLDDWRGWSFSTGDNNPAAGRSNQTGQAVAHGSEVAGLVGAAGNNNVGIATINWNTKIMPLQALSDDGYGFSSDVAAAIYYAVDNGASVINMSLGGVDYDPTTRAATDYAYANGVVVIAAAGNCGTGSEQGCETVSAGFIGYPARNPHVISVGASTSTDARASFGSYGDALDVTAPGSGAINSPTWTAANQTSLYSGSLYGTSFASPYVASLASLIKSIRPSSTVDDITAIILASARKPVSMSGSPYTTQLGHGIIDAGKSLSVASSLNANENVPLLLQAGGPKSEHSFANTSTLGSGCQSVQISTYCTVWLQQENTSYDRYLPYTLTNNSLLAGWTWTTSMLTSGSWQARAVQGNLVSPVYSLSSK